MRNILNKLHAILIDTLFELPESCHRYLNERMDKYAGEIEKLNIELKESSVTDELTGCYNHRYFQHILNIEIGRAARYAYPLSL